MTVHDVRQRDAFLAGFRAAWRHSTKKPDEIHSMAKDAWNEVCLIDELRLQEYDK